MQSRHLTRKIRCTPSRLPNLGFAFSHSPFFLDLAQDSGIVVGVEMGGNPLQGEWDHIRPHFERARKAGLRSILPPNCSHHHPSYGIQGCCIYICSTFLKERKDTLSPSESHIMRRVSLHFAENKGAEKEHIDILDFAPERVGHAVFMSRAISDRLIASRIPVEVCLTCHEAFYKVCSRTCPCYVWVEAAM